jgi:hypothetical protein
MELVVHGTDEQHAMSSHELRSALMLTVEFSKCINLYSPPSIIRMTKSRRMRWAGHVARMGEKRNAYTTLVGKPEGRRQFGRPRRKWVDNIKMHLREIGWDG